MHRSLIAALATTAVAAPLSVALPAQAAPTALFVSASSRCDDATTDSTATPFCTITAATKQAVAGDTISVAGGTYREQVEAKVSGLTFKATQPATIDGASRFNIGFVVRNVDGVTIDGFTVRNQVVHGIIIDAASNVTVRNVAVENAGNHGIDVPDSNRVTITGVEVRGSGGIGIRLAGTADSTVSSSLSTQNVGHGVTVQSSTLQASSGDTVRTTVSSFNEDPAVRKSTGINVAEGSTNTLVERNTTYGNDDSGIQVYSRAAGTVVRRNLTYDNGDHGIDMNAVPGSTVVSNTSVGNYAVGINVENFSTGVTLRDNVSVDDGSSSDRTEGNYRVEAGSEPGTTLDRDLAYQSFSDTRLWFWGGVGYTSRSALTSASAQEANGLQANPEFVSLVDRNLAPGPGSPMIDSAFSDAPGWSSRDRFGVSPVDDPETSDTGSGSIGFADLGAIERTSAASPPAVPPPPPADTTPPSAVLTARPATLAAGGTTTLDASGSTDDRAIVSYTFDCDNGHSTTTTVPTASCTYPTAGDFMATVVVKDAANHAVQAISRVTVTAPTAPPPPTVIAPTAHFRVSDRTPARGQRLTINASASTGSATKMFRFKCGGQAATAWRLSPKATCRLGRLGYQRIVVWVKNSAGVDDAVLRVRVHRG